MWSISKNRLWLLAACAALAILGLCGCMSSPHEGDLPWSPSASWEGTPALPGGMFNPQ